MAKQTDALGELKAAIRSGNPERLYIFYGEETFLLHYYLDALRKKVLDELTEAFNFHHFTEESFSLEAFADAVENLPMMAERTLVQVDDVDVLKGLPESQREKLASVLTDIPEYCTVVFTFETVAWKQGKDAVSEAVAKAGQQIQFARQEPRDLIPWISRHFAKLGKRISPELCAYLIEITGGTMTALGGEIDKIAAFSGAEEIVRQDIDAVTEPVMDAVVFQMTDRMGEGDYGGALQKLQQLFKQQQEPIAILGAVGNHFRRLGAARTLLDQGKGSDTLAALYGMKDYPARKLMGAARKFSQEFCAKAAEQVLETDYKMKTSFDDRERLLEQLILVLAQEARHD